ncbi:hypothetical protein GALMADRAFT_77771, partial [Galerina marginata CBS 339.88]
HDDEPVEVDDWTQSYVHITQDIIPNDETRTKLRRQAQHWRGITAVTASPVPPTSTHNPLLSFHTHPGVLPPTYGLHTTLPIPASRLITPYTSTITPSASYLADPLNAYAHLGMPKPYVHLVGPPLDVALDARGAGGEGRFVRNGCRPNAVLRPVLCAGAGVGAGGKENVKEGKKSPQPSGKGKERAIDPDADSSGSTLSFGVFALRDLKAGEEVVLGWEWDDGNAVHSLPALLKTPGMFP